MARPLSRIRSVVVAASLTALLYFPARAHGEPATPASAADRWQSFIDEAAARFAIPAPWIAAVIRVESGGNPKAVSPKGAVGLMQLMPDTYAELRARYGLGSDPGDAHDNIIAGTAYLRDMRERFGSAGFIAAYNVGPQRYEVHLATGRPLPDETLAYAAQLAPLLSGTQPVGGVMATGHRRSWQRSPLFVTRRSDGSTDTHSALEPPASLTRDDRSIADLSALVPVSSSLFIRGPGAHGNP